MNEDGPTLNRTTQGMAILLAIASALCLVCLRLIMGGPLLRAQDRSISYPMTEPRLRDLCLVCDGSLTKADRVYEIDGQRVPVHAGACDEQFKQDPNRYLAKLKPRGAFLAADPSVIRNFSSRWLVFGLYTIAGLIFAGMCAYRAVNQDLRPVSWFFWGLFFNVFAYLVLISRRAEKPARSPWGVPHGLAKVPQTYSPDRCPVCGKMNHPSARACSTCGNNLEPRVASEVAKSGL